MDKHRRIMEWYTWMGNFIFQTTRKFESKFYKKLQTSRYKTFRTTKNA